MFLLVRAIESVEKCISLSHEFTHHDTWEATVRHSIANRTVLVLLSLHRAFDFGDMSISGTEMQTNGEEVRFNLVKLRVSVNIGDPEAPRIVFFEHIFELIHDTGSRATQRERDRAVFDAPGDGMKNCNTVNIVKINTEGDVLDVFIHGCGNGHRRKGRNVISGL